MLFEIFKNSHILAKRGLARLYEPRLDSNTRITQRDRVFDSYYSIYASNSEYSTHIIWTYASNSEYLTHITHIGWIVWIVQIHQIIRVFTRIICIFHARSSNTSNNKYILALFNVFKLFELLESMRVLDLNTHIDSPRLA